MKRVAGIALLLAMIPDAAWASCDSIPESSGFVHLVQFALVAFGVSHLAGSIFVIVKNSQTPVHFKSKATGIFLALMLLGFASIAFSLFIPSLYKGALELTLEYGAFLKVELLAGTVFAVLLVIADAVLLKHTTQVGRDGRLVQKTDFLRRVLMASGFFLIAVLVSTQLYVCFSNTSAVEKITCCRPNVQCNDLIEDVSCTPAGQYTCGYLDCYKCGQDSRPVFPWAVPTLDYGQ